jgi:hypothetical protein
MGYEAGVGRVSARKAVSDMANEKPRPDAP